MMKKGFTTILLLTGVLSIYSQNENLKLKKTTNMKNTALLVNANQHVRKGEYEAYLSYLTEDTKWEFVGERTLLGKEAVRQYIKDFYLAPPVFDMEKAIEQGDFVTATGSIALKNVNGEYDHYSYCDIWRFDNGKIAELKAFVIEKKS
ncbi:nuclear transport factor 2 family protein [Flavobacterium sp. CFBP9031]|uniref:nuclear transport factor 2 family protein n=1 Tax=Flavobacterium sp. CFBP9031 TaxID=3096538 RepID=UPI002A6A8974|nr:nuclear transport factor 2 family protein [Flavobacterium sp. CFBP9031]MDY0986617.1 nuclear transport factor 2 family protein [Flavobacterium sp. CFBP9031]